MSIETMNTLRETVAGSDHEACKAIYRGIVANLPSGTMRDWFYGKGGLRITTVQVNGMGVWAPTGRTANTKAKTYVQLDGSRRDYAGLKVMHADARVLIVDGKRESIAYYVED